MARVFNLNRKELKQYSILKLADFEGTDYSIIRVKGQNFIANKIDKDYRLNHRVDKMCKLGGYFVTVEEVQRGHSVKCIDIDKGNIRSLGVFKEVEIFNDCIRVLTLLDNKLLIDGWYLEDEMEQGWY